MVNKLVSVKRVIAKVFRDLDLDENTHRISDFIEWCGEAMEKIGSFPQFYHKVSGKDGTPMLELDGYQTILPYDLHKVTQIAYAPSENGPYYPMRKASGSFDSGIKNTTTTDVVGTMPESALVDLTMSLYDLTYEQALNKINTEPNIRSMLSNLLSENNDPTQPGGSSVDTYDYTYTITDRYIKTNVESGYLMVSYQAIPTDADGYPLIPDMVSFQEALYWYVNMKLLYPQWKLGQVRDAIYYDARRSWNYYCKQAYGDALMPDRDEMESIKNTWIKLVPEINSHSNFFNTLGQQEVVYNSNKN